MSPDEPLVMAPPWQVAHWFNATPALSLDALRGKVVLLHAFQMLCPGCVAHALPQAQRVAVAFAGAPVAVVGLHTVFEHHAVMGPEALAAFLHEYRVNYPVGVDVPGPAGDPIPRTMRAYAMRGTPTTVLIDAQGRLRWQMFGVCEDLLLGAEIGALLVEAGTSPPGTATTGERCALG